VRKPGGGRSVGVLKALVFAVMVFTILPSSAFASTAFVRASNGLLVYRAAPGETNVVEIGEATGANIVDRGAVITAGTGCTQVSDHEVHCVGPSPFGIQAAQIRLRDRRDTASFLFQDSVPFSFYGQEGDDTLTLCSQCPAVLLGGRGADALHGGDLGVASREDVAATRSRPVSRAARCVEGKGPTDWWGAREGISSSPATVRIVHLVAAAATPSARGRFSRRLEGRQGGRFGEGGFRPGRHPIDCDVLRELDADPLDNGRRSPRKPLRAVAARLLGRKPR
jgi:hypothetical protein